MDDEIFRNRVDTEGVEVKKCVSDVSEGFFLELPLVKVGGKDYEMGGSGYRIIGNMEFRSMLEGLNMSYEEFSCWFGGDVSELESFVNDGLISQELSDRLRSIVYVLGVAGLLLGRCK